MPSGHKGERVNTNNVHHRARSTTAAVDKLQTPVASTGIVHRQLYVTTHLRALPSVDSFSAARMTRLLPQPNTQRCKLVWGGRGLDKEILREVSGWFVAGYDRTQKFAASTLWGNSDRYPEFAENAHADDRSRPFCSLRPRLEFCAASSVISCVQPALCSSFAGKFGCNIRLSKTTTPQSQPVAPVV